MSYTLDFKAIAATPIADVAKLLGFSLTEKNEQLVGQCPISQLTNPTAFKITPSMNRFICFCTECKKLPKQGGDVIEMVRRFRRFANPRDAAMEIQKLSGAGKADDNPSAKQEASQPSKPSGFDPLTYLETLDPAHEALGSLGLSPETLRDAKAGYASKGLNRGRLAVALCDDGKITAFIGVALKGESPQYLMPKGMPLPFWFGLDNLQEGDEARIVATIPDVLQAVENGCTSVICPLAPTTHEALTELAAAMEQHRCTVAW